MKWVLGMMKEVFFWINENKIIHVGFTYCDFRRKGISLQTMKTPKALAYRLLLVLLGCQLLIPGQTHAQDLTSRLSFRRFTTLDGLPQMQTENVWQDSRGYIYVGTLSGFARYDGLEMTPYMQGRRVNILSFCETDGELRALGFKRYWIFDDGRLTLRQYDPHKRWMINNLNSPDLPQGYILLEDNNETRRRLCRWEKDHCDTLSADPMLDKMMPDRKLYMDSTTLYLPTEEGLFVSERQQPFRQISTKEDVYCLHRVGNTLYALAGDGIYTVRGNVMTLQTAYHFEAPDYGLQARHDYRGHLVIADSHTLYVYDGKQVEKKAGGFNLIKNIFVDKWNRLWMATYQGLYCFFTMDFQNHRLADENDIVRAVAVDGEGCLVMGTLNGKVLVEGETILDESDNFFIPGAAVVDGHVYMAGKEGIYRVEGRKVQRVREQYDHYQFISAAMGKVVFGTRNMVLTYDPQTERTDTLTDEIPHPWCAAADADGRLWVGSTYGLFYLAHGVDKKWRTTQMEYSQTLTVTAMDSDRDGNILFSSGDSLFLIRHGEVESLTEAIPMLTGHEIRSLHISPKGFLVIAVMDGMIIARTDDNWHLSDACFLDHKNGMTLIEPQMSPMAETADGTVWLAGLEEMASFSPERLLQGLMEDMIVKPPLKWWQRWWVWLFPLALLTIAVWMTARRMEHVRSKKAMETLRREKMQKELQINAIRLKSIPHFNSNVLSGIEYFVMKHSVEEASYYLGLYSKFTNSTLADIDLPARSVQEEVDYLENYLKLEKMRFGDKLTYTIRIGEDVNRQMLLPNMLLHTYCQNAIKHGIAPKETTGNVDVCIERFIKDDHEWIKVAVTDDGIGRTAAAGLKKESNKMGLAILMEQINLHNQINRHAIRQYVEDIVADGATGTRYVMEIPEGYIFE